MSVIKVKDLQEFLSTWDKQLEIDDQDFEEALMEELGLKITVEAD